jgi:hypothetical protein
MRLTGTDMVEVFCWRGISRPSRKDRVPVRMLSSGEYRGGLRYIVKG